MKKLMKNNLKVFIAIILTAIICISGTAYAAIRIQADEIGYKNGTVEDALNDLYSSVGAEIGSLHSSYSYGNTRLAENTTTLQLTKNKYICEAIYAETNSNSSQQSLVNENHSGVSNLSISGCDTIKHLGEKGIAVGTQITMGNQYVIVDLFKKVFTCEVDSTKNITVTYSTSAAWPAVQIHLDCVDIK